MMGSTLVPARVRIANKHFIDRLAESGRPPDMTKHRDE